MITPGYSPLGEVIIGASGVLKIAAARGIKYPDGPRNDLGSPAWTDKSLLPRKTTESLFQQIFLQVPKPTGSCGEDDAGSEGGGGVTEPLNPRRRSRLEWLERSKCRDVISLSVIFSILWCQIPFRIDYRLNE